MKFTVEKTLKVNSRETVIDRVIIKMFASYHFLAGLIYLQVKYLHNAILKGIPIIKTIRPTPLRFNK